MLSAMVSLKGEPCGAWNGINCIHHLQNGIEYTGSIGHQIAAASLLLMILNFILNDRN